MSSRAAAWLLGGLAVRELVNWPRLPSGEGEPCEHVVIAVRAEKPALLADTVDHIRRLNPTVIISIVSRDPRPDELHLPAEVRYVQLQCDGSKGALINALLASGCLDDATWITLYDADSRPLAVSHAADARHPVSQQLSLYRVSAGARGFWQGCATNQTAWSLGYEHRRLRGSRPHYLVGHGLTLAVAELRSFPFRPGLPGEDLLLGYERSLAGRGSVLSPSVDVAGAPESLQEFVAQSGRWFAGEVSALRSVGGRWPPSPGQASFMARRGLGLSFWIAGPWLVVAAGTAAAARGSRVHRAIGLSAAIVRYLRWRETEASDQTDLRGPLHAGLRFMGFNAKPALASAGAVWAVHRHVLPGTLNQMPKARPLT